MYEAERKGKIAAARKLLTQRQRKGVVSLNPQGSSPSSVESLKKDAKEADGTIDPNPTTFFDSLPPLEPSKRENADKEAYSNSRRELPSPQQVIRASSLFPDNNISQPNVVNVNRDKRELEQLRENSEVQKHTIQILVSEKSELQVLVSRLQEELKNKEAACEELSGRLRVSRCEVGNLRSEVSYLREGQNEHNKILHRLERDLQASTAASNDLRKQLDDSHDEVKDLKRRIDQGVNEKLELSENIKVLESQLSLANVKLQQMNNESVSLVVSTNCSLESEKEELKIKVNTLEKEKQQIARQCEEYISSLNNQLKNLSSKYEAASIDKEENALRVNSLITHIGELEKQIHSQNLSITLHKSNVQPTVDEEIKNKDEEIARLNTLIEEKDKTLDDFSLEMATYQRTIEELENNLSRVADIPDAKLLQAAMESDRVAASRAIEQNKELKLQFQEMKDAYISALDKALEQSTELELKESTNANLKDELKMYKEKYEKMRGAENIDSSSQTYDVTSENHGYPPVSPEAMKLLEEKFKKKMNEFAELLDEKQRLEHLVIQLQSETETIGEYITLYQNQRILLQQRAVERDQQMSALAKEREELRSKLAQLNCLVPSLIQQNQSCPSQNDSSPPETECEEKTSERILQLLDEIGTSSLIQESTNNFHPCLYCSGKLITV